MAFYQENPGEWTMDEFEHRWRGMELKRKLDAPMDPKDVSIARAKQFEANKAAKERAKQQVEI